MIPRSIFFVKNNLYPKDQRLTKNYGLIILCYLLSKQFHFLNQSFGIPKRFQDRHYAQKWGTSFLDLFKTQILLNHKGIGKLFKQIFTL